MGEERNTRVRASQIRSIFPDDIEATNVYVDNYVPSYDEATGKFTWIAVAGGISVLNDLTDVDFDTGTPNDNDVLTYDLATGKWKAEASAGGALTLNELTDVEFDTGTPLDGYILVYDESTGVEKWKASHKISTDGTLSGESDTNIPTEKAVKVYADTNKSAKHILVNKEY